MARPVNVAVLRQDPRLERAVLDRLDKDGLGGALFDGVDDLLAAEAAVLDDVQVLFAPGYAAVDGPLLDRLTGLSGVIATSMGIEGFDRVAATARGILIGNGQIAESVDSMAEGTILMLLAAAYQLPAAVAAMADGAWPKPLARGRLVKAMTVGIVGYGRIAQAVVARLTSFGCRLVVSAPRIHVPLPAGVDAISLDELVSSSDAIILLASLGTDSRHLLDAETIARIKPGAIVVNMARGGLIDEPALVRAAEKGRLGCLALDVFEQEPLPPMAAVRALPNAILTPHCIGHTNDTLTRLPLHAMEGIHCLLQGEPPPSLVNPEALPIWRARQVKRDSNSTASH